MSRLTPQIAATHASAASFAFFTLDETTNKVDSCHEFKVGTKVVATFDVSRTDAFKAWCKDNDVDLQVLPCWMSVRTPSHYCDICGRGYEGDLCPHCEAHAQRHIDAGDYAFEAMMAARGI